MSARFVTFACLAAFGVVSLTAQEPSRGPDGGTAYRVSGVELLSIPDKPFFAKTATEWTRTLEDGSTVKIHLNARLARDSQGRTYRERVSFVPEGSDERSRINEIMISDPQKRTRTTCVLATRHCSIAQYFPRMSFVTQPDGPFANGTRSLAREYLGNTVINDMTVTGTRETTTINAGAMGNERPLVTTREFWYSPDIQTNILTTRKDPREGTQVIRLSEVSQTEPPEKTFQIPQGFTVQDDRTPSPTSRPLPQD